MKVGARKNNARRHRNERQSVRSWGTIVLGAVGILVFGGIPLWVGLQLGQKRSLAEGIRASGAWVEEAMLSGLTALFANPELAELESEVPAPVHPKLAAVPSPSAPDQRSQPLTPAEQLEREKSALPRSFSSGLFTVQVGSFFEPGPAQDLTKFLKGRGFPHAFVSQSVLPGKQTPWFRVWVGYYNDFNSAREVGAFLEAKETVERALVRRADTLESTLR